MNKRVEGRRREMMEKYDWSGGEAYGWRFTIRGERKMGREESGK